MIGTKGSRYTKEIIQLGPQLTTWCKPLKSADSGWLKFHLVEIWCCHQSTGWLKKGDIIWLLVDDTNDMQRKALPANKMIASQYLTKINEAADGSYESISMTSAQNIDEKEDYDEMQVLQIQSLT